jgi:hypothetical protein
MKIGLKTYRVPLQSNPNRNASRFIKITNITENIKAILATFNGLKFV